MTSTRRVLVVDDDPAVAEVVTAALREMDVEVRSALTGDQAFACISQAAPDLLLLDIRLPHADGLEIFRVLKERGPEFPVVLISSHTSMELTVEAMREGAYDYLDKPLRVSQIVELVDRILVAEERCTGSGAAVEELLPDAPVQLLGRSPPMVELYKTIGRVADTNATVLLTGESGTGKGMVAQVIHEKSRRSERPFQAVNCAAIPESLLESELFGHEEGAFTGASRDKPGKFELAGEGTLFLDEITELPVGLQPKLLRALEEREIERLGGTSRVVVGARLIGATNRDPEKAVAEGRLREDLYFRLAVVRVEVPPLRDRIGDVRLLTQHFVARLGPEVGRRVDGISEEVHERFAAYPWPGNVRELRNVVERSLILGRGPVLKAADLPRLDGEAGGGPGSEEDARAAFRRLAERGRSLEDVEKRYVAAVLRSTEGNQTRAAEILGVHRSTLRRKIDAWGLELPG